VSEYEDDPFDLAPEEPSAPQPERRVVDLAMYLDGSYEPPVPSVGAQRDDGVRLLYPSRWHTLIALTTAGKSWLGLWHAVEQMAAGDVVAYAHFEESSPVGTIARLRALGVADDVIRKQFAWLDCSTRWPGGAFAKTLAELPKPPALVILDGINAACGQHNWPVDKPEAVGSYRAWFVAPSTALGAAVLSLGHPPKSRERQGERHGFGSTAWLDEVDGVGMRMEASKKAPIRQGARGYSALYVVKDRYGEVQRHGQIEAERESGWFYLGAFTIDSSEAGHSRACLTVPQESEDGTTRDAVDRLGDDVLHWLVRHGGRFQSQKLLGEALRAAKVPFSDGDLAPALIRLHERGVISWPDAGRGKARPGFVVQQDDESVSDMTYATYANPFQDKTAAQPTSATSAHPKGCAQSAEVPEEAATSAAQRSAEVRRGRRGTDLMNGKVRIGGKCSVCGVGMDTHLTNQGLTAHPTCT
jgi:hypothetical protein